MIKMSDTGTAGQLEMRMSGTISSEDYEYVLTPAHIGRPSRAN